MNNLNENFIYQQKQNKENQDLSKNNYKIANII